MDGWCRGRNRAGGDDIFDQINELENDLTRYYPSSTTVGAQKGRTGMTGGVTILGGG